LRQFCSYSIYSISWKKNFSAAIKLLEEKNAQPKPQQPLPITAIAPRVLNSVQSKNIQQL
jgi:hypothetical protein